MRTVLISSFLCAALLFSSCASIFTKTSYPVTINSNPEGAQISIVNKSGTAVYQGKTPATAVLKSSNKYMSGERYTITISKQGYQDQVVYIDSKIEGWYWGNILLGGLVGMLVVDPLTGAMYKLDTSVVDVTLDKGNGGVALNIIDYNTLDDSTKEKLVRLD